MRSLAEEIKDKVDIAEVIGSYIKLTSAGVNLKAQCPFHSEKTPSFIVSKEKQIFHCFGCDKGGDVITFVQDMEGVDFKEALKILADKAGIDVSKFKFKGDGVRKEKKDIMYSILENTALFFQKTLLSSSGEKGRKYLRNRGVQKDVIDQFKLGFAPKGNNKNQPTALYEYLSRKGFSNEDILASGSVFNYSRKGGSAYLDRFRNRLIFPISDALGRVVGFSARILPGEEDNQGKYINTPDTMLYNKSNLLYGFHLAKTTIRKKNELVLLEGNLDVVLSHQTGVRQAVATCGTALTKDQLKIIKRYTKNLVLAFDADMAGIKATKKAADLAWEDGFDVKIVPIPVGKDVADIVRENPKNWIEKSQKRKSLVDFFFDLAFKKRTLDIDQKKALGDKMLTIISSLPSEVERAHYMHRLSEELNTPENLLWEKLAVMKQKVLKYQREEEIKNSTVPHDRYFLLEERIIGLIYNYPQLYFKEPNLSKILFQNPSLEAIWKEMVETLEKMSKKRKQTLAFKKYSWKMSNRDLALRASKIAVKAEEENIQGALQDKKDETERAENELNICTKALFEKSLLNQRQEINNMIREAQAKGDRTKLKDLIAKFQKISKEISKIENI